MAQFYGDQDDSKLRDASLGPYPAGGGRSESVDPRDKTVQAEGYNVYSGEPENVTYRTEEVLSGLSSPTPEKLRSTDHDGWNIPGEQCQKDYGRNNDIRLNDDFGADRVSSKLGESGCENLGYQNNGGPASYQASNGSRYEGLSEALDLKEDGSSGGSAGEDEGYGGETQDMGVGEKPVSVHFQESPYTQYDSKQDYDKKGYGGESFPLKEEKISTAGTYAYDYPDPQQAPAEQLQKQEGMKEKLKEKLLPCLKPRTPDDIHDQEPVEHDDAVAHKRHGLVGKIKEKLAS